MGYCFFLHTNLSQFSNGTAFHLQFHLVKEDEWFQQFVLFIPSAAYLWKRLNSVNAHTLFHECILFFLDKTTYTIWLNALETFYISSYIWECSLHNICFRFLVSIVFPSFCIPKTIIMTTTTPKQQQCVFPCFKLLTATNSLDNTFFVVSKYRWVKFCWPIPNWRKNTLSSGCFVYFSLFSLETQKRTIVNMTQ